MVGGDGDLGAHRPLGEGEGAGDARPAPERGPAERTPRDGGAGSDSGGGAPFRDLVGSMLDCMLVVDPESRVLFANAAAARLTGFRSPEEMVGHNTLEFVHPDHHGLLMGNLQAVIGGEGRSQTLYRVRSIDGGEGWVETSGARIEFDGRPADLVVYRDVTARVRAEEALRHRLELERALASISARFARGGDLAGSIEEGLGEIGRACGATHAHFIPLPPDVPGATGALEWRVEGEPSQLGTFMSVLAAGDAQWATDRLARGEVLDLRAHGAMDAATNEAKEAMSRLGIRSLLALPVMSDGRLAGAIGFNCAGRACAWCEGDVALLCAVAGIVGDAIARDRAGALLGHHLELESALVSISEKFLGGGGLGPAIDGSLAELGRATGAQCAYLFVLREGGGLVDNTHEWCAEGAPPGKASLQGVRPSDLPWLAERLGRGETVRVHDAEALPPEAMAERAALAAHGARSCILVPVLVRGTTAGFIGIGNPDARRADLGDDEALMRAVAHIIGLALERHGAEAELASEEAFSFTLLESIHDGAVLLDREGTIMYANPAFCRMTGFEADELVGARPPYPFWPPEERGRLGGMMKRVLEGGGADLPCERRFSRRDGSPLHALVTPLQMVGPDGSVAGHLGVVKDVTARRRAEDLERERSRAELYAILASALPAFAGNVPASARDLMVRAFSERFESLMRPGFERAAGARAEGGACDTLLGGYVTWLSGLFGALGARSSASDWTYGQRFELLSCPWREEAHGNPVFCLLSRAQAMRSFAWTGLSGSVRQLSAIADGADACRFEVALAPGAGTRVPGPADGGERARSGADEGK